MQLGLALYGFYAIRSFEKYTVPATVVVMAVMTVVAMSHRRQLDLPARRPTPGDKVTAITQLLTAIGIGWGLTWIPYASDYSRFVRHRRLRASRCSGRPRPACTSRPSGWPRSAPAWPAPATAATRRRWWSARSAVMAIPVLLLLMHGPIATNILNLYSCSLAALSIGVRAARWKVTLIAGRGGVGGARRLRQRRQLRPRLRPLDGVDPGVDQPVGGRSCWSTSS